MHTLHSHPWVHPNVPCSELSRVPCQGPPQRWAKPKFARPWFLLRKSKGGAIVPPSFLQKGIWWRITNPNLITVSAVNHRWLVFALACVFSAMFDSIPTSASQFSHDSARHNTNTTFIPLYFQCSLTRSVLDYICTPSTLLATSRE